MLHLDRAARLEWDRRRRGGGSRSHDFCPAALNCAVSARRVPRFPARPAALGMAPMRTSLGQPLGEAGGNRHRLSVGHRRLGSAPPDGVKVNTRTIRAAFRGAATPCLAQKRPYSSFPSAQRALGLPWRFPGRSQGKRWWWKGPPLLARRTQAQAPQSCFAARVRCWGRSRLPMPMRQRRWLRSSSSWMSFSVGGCWCRR